MSFWFVITPSSSAHVNEKPDPSLSSQASLAFLPYLSYSFYESIITRLLLNCFSFTTSPSHGQTPRRAFIAVGLLASLLTHSCFPNCRLVDEAQLSGGRMQFIATRAIKKGEALTVSYVDTTLNKLGRAEALMQYGFACNCSRCKREKGFEAELAKYYAEMHIPPPVDSEK